MSERKGIGAFYLPPFVPGGEWPERLAVGHPMEGDERRAYVPERARRDAGERECPYCDRAGARPIVLDESELGGRIRVGWIGGRPVLMAGTRRGYDVAARIRFCPMCARDLGGEG